MTYPTADRDPSAHTAEATVSTFSFGPCWCRAVPGSDGSFDVFRQRSVKAELDRDILVVSDRVPPNGVPMVRRQLEALSNPIVIATRSCPAAGWYWKTSPYEWVDAGEIVDVDHRVDACLTGQPENVFAALASFGRNVSTRSHLSALTEAI